MLSSRVQAALDQVREVQDRLIQRQMFRGYSAWARILSGGVALSASAVMSSPSFPRTATAHVAGWALVLAIALVLNGGAVLHWFLFSPDVRRDIRRLKPVIDVIPPLFVGGILSGVFIINGGHDHLFGTWMCLFGLTNIASRHCLPRGIFALGMFYLACGTTCLLLPGLSFTNPWPMGLVFFTGEMLGGCVFQGLRDTSVRTIVTDRSWEDDEHDHA